jgi:hypothetical protein
MPRPKQRRRYPKPKPVTIRHQDNDAPDVVPADRFLEYQYGRQARPVFEMADTDESFDYIELQRYLGLKTGDVIVPLVARGGGLLWFVVEVDGPGRTVTARTVIFGEPCEGTFAFVEIDLPTPRTIEDVVDADEARRRTGLPTTPRARRSESVVWTVASEELDVTSLPSRYSKLLDLPTAPCHGYANGCECARCSSPGWVLGRAA